jgi:hypothetical protein
MSWQQGHQYTEEAVRSKQLANAVDESLKGDKPSLPSAKLSGRAWLLIALVVVAIVAAIFLLNVL